MKDAEISRSIEKQTVLSLLEAADRLRRHFNEVLAFSGLTLQQYNILRILRGAGAEGLPTLEVGARMIEKTPGVTRLLDRLEKKGFVHRIRSDRDRRQVFCHTTKSAISLLSKLEKPIAESDRTCTASLNRTELLQLKRLASRVAL